MVSKPFVFEVFSCEASSTFRNLTHLLTDTPLAFNLSSVIQIHTGICRNIRRQSGECLFMQGMQENTGEYRGIQGNTGEYRGIQENKREYSKMKWEIC